MHIKEILKTMNCRCSSSCIRISGSLLNIITITVPTRSNFRSVVIPTNTIVGTGIGSIVLVPHFDENGIHPPCLLGIAW